MEQTNKICYTLNVLKNEVIIMQPRQHELGKIIFHFYKAVFDFKLNDNEMNMCTSHQTDTNTSLSLSYFTISASTVFINKYIIMPPVFKY